MQRAEVAAVDRFRGVRERLAAEGPRSVISEMRRPGNEQGRVDRASHRACRRGAIARARGRPRLVPPSLLARGQEARHTGLREVQVRRSPSRRSIIRSTRQLVPLHPPAFEERRQLRLRARPRSDGGRWRRKHLSRSGRTAEPTRCSRWSSTAGCTRPPSARRRHEWKVGSREPGLTVRNEITAFK